MRNTYITRLPASVSSFLLRSICGILLLSFLVGCSGRYQWGNPGTLEFKTVHVLPIANESFAPQAHAVLAGQLRDFIIRDGRLRLVNSADAADALLEVTLVDYRRTGSTRDPSDTTRVLTTDLQLEASINLLKGDSNEAWFRNRTVTASSSVYSSNLFAAPGSVADLRQDTLEAEFQEMPNLTRELARRIADEILNAW
jgi:hypothetical protein